MKVRAQYLSMPLCLLPTRMADFEMDSFSIVSMTSTVLANSADFASSSEVAE